MSKRDLLVEIGCEELPVDYIPPVLRQLEKMAGEKFNAARLSFDRLETQATPRRLVLRIQGLAEQQPNVMKELLGPKKALAYQTDGSLTPAGEGFLKKTGLNANQVQMKDDRMWAQVEDAGKPAQTLLPEILGAIIKSLTFPKSMHWEASGARFARPVRSLLVLFGQESIPLAFADVTSGRMTQLHPLNDRKYAEVKQPSDYAGILKQGHVTLSIQERREQLAEKLAAEAQKLGGRIVPDEALLDMVVMMVEFPGVLSGKMATAFLQMPREIVTTAMREHQRYFAVEDAAGKLLPYFLAAHDNPFAPGETMRPGCERVLTARLKDAEFFYQEDLKTQLKDRVPELARVLWIKGLGNLLDKTKRLESLAGWLADRLEAAAKPYAVEAAHLSKADLITNMVQEKEFTSLQGVMGGFYAKAQGIAEQTAAGIGEQYRPRSAGDAPPQTPAGRILALADKLDHIVGCWGAGFIPTGAKDPYALRRATQGIITITVDAGYRYSSAEVLRRSIANFETFRGREDQIVSEVKAFIQGRMETELQNRGIAPDLIQAVLGVWWDDLAAVVKKAEAIHALRQGDSQFGEKIITFSRVVNILPKNTIRAVVPETPDLAMDLSLMSDDAEKQLQAAYQKTGHSIAELSLAGDFKASFGRLAELKPIIDLFFEKVMVMDQDEKIRTNRLNLLTNLARKIWSLADFSKLVVSAK
jgi:glycyl-tRNA synthetase beta chain